MTFDEQVKELRGKVVPRQSSKKKSDCTPEEWAAHADYAAAWRSANADKERERCRQWKSVNADKAKRSRQKAVKKWQASNKEKERERKRTYMAARLRSDPEFRILVNLRGRLCQAIKGNFKNGSAVRDLGCTIEELWVYLESKFQPGMTRENFGSAWELDHIYPLSKANLQDKAEFLAANNWRNLQPLTPSCNYSKNDEVTPEAQSLFDSLVKEFGQRKQDQQ